MITGALARQWRKIPLSEAATVNPTRSPVYSAEHLLFSFVPMAAVHEEMAGVDVSESRPLKDVRSGYTQFMSGDVLFAKITPCMENGKIAVVPDLPSPVGYGSTELHVLRPRDGVLSRWIAYFLSRSEFRRAAQRNMSGSAGQLRVPKKWLEAQEIPIPDEPEQRRIIERVDELFSDLDAGVAALERAKANLARYRAATLRAAAEGALTEIVPDRPLFDQPMWKPLETVIGELDQGWSPKCHKQPAVTNEWGVIKTTAVQPMRYLDQENKRLPQTLEPRPELEVAPGDLLVTRAGPRGRCGVVCMVRKTRKRLMVCDKVYRIRCREKAARPAYLELVLNTPQVQASIEKMKTGISDSGVNLTQGGLRRVAILSLIHI